MQIVGDITSQALLTRSTMFGPIQGAVSFPERPVPVDGGDVEMDTADEAAPEPGHDPAPTFPAMLAAGTARASAGQLTSAALARSGVRNIYCPRRCHVVNNPLHTCASLPDAWQHLINDTQQRLVDARWHPGGLLRRCTHVAEPRVPSRKGTPVTLSANTR